MQTLVPSALARVRARPRRSGPARNARAPRVEPGKVPQACTQERAARLRNTIAPLVMRRLSADESHSASLNVATINTNLQTKELLGA